MERTKNKISPKPWRKNLYENDGYPDNYTDKSFLDELRKNVNVRLVSYKEAFIGASLVTQEFCLVVFFVISFTCLHNGWIEPEVIFCQSGIVSLLCYIFYIYNELGIMRHVRTILVFLVFGYILSPVLKTLTESISTDTIYTTTVFMMLIHLIFFDYGVKALIVSSSLSLNSAIFGSICLASRLPTPLHAFILLTMSVECFVLLPLVLAKVGNSFCIIFALTGLATYALWMISSTITVLFIFALIFINLLCPFWFVRWYRYKENIYGPWDEAIVHIPQG